MRSLKLPQLTQWALSKFLEPLCALREKSFETMQMKSDSLALGIDLGGTEVRSSVIDSHGNMISRDCRAAPAGKEEAEVIEAVLESAGRSLNRASIETGIIERIGVAVRKATNSESGVHSSPDLPEWDPASLKSILEKALSAEAFLIDPAKAAAYGEYRFGAARGFRHVLYIAINSGITGGVIMDGKLYTGASGTAGEFGHMIISDSGPGCNCGSFGCWETLASETAMVRDAKEKIAEGIQTKIVDSVSGDPEKVTAGVIQTAAEEGDLLARELIAKTGYSLGIGFANLINLFNPEIIVIHGGLFDMGDALLTSAYEAAGERAKKIARDAVRFAPAVLGKNSGMLGAAAFSMETVA